MSTQPLSFEDWLFCIFDNDADRVPDLWIDPDCDRLDLPVRTPGEHVRGRGES